MVGGQINPVISVIIDNKVRQVLQSVTILLQRATGITKCDGYYKVRQYIV